MSRARPFLAMAATLTLVFAAPGGRAAGWSGFYTASAKAPEPTVEEAADSARGATDENICVREILHAQARYGIPDNLLLAIGLQEAGTKRNGQLTIWPWAVNAEGEGRIFPNRKAALTWVELLRAAGVESIDLGCMQINMRWHPEAFAAPVDGFDAAQNVDYAARFLRNLYAKTGDWMLAAGSYHSFSPDKRDVYLERLNRNLVVANARIDEFVALAGVDGGSSRLARAEQPPEPSFKDGIFWSAWLSLKDGGEHRRGIYSPRDMEPGLPEFTEHN